MSVAVHPLTLSERSAYACYVASHPEATVYHRLEWLDTLRCAFSYVPVPLVAWSGGDIVGALPLCYVHTALEGRRLVGLPFSHRVRPLGSAQMIAELLLAAQEFVCRMECRFVEVHADLDDTMMSEWTAMVCYMNTSMKLPSDEELHYRSLRANTRQQLDQALRNPDLQVVAVKEEETLKRFARLVLHTRKRKGSLTYPWSFYRALLTLLLPRDLIRLEIVSWKGQDVAALATLRHKDGAIYGYGGAVENPEALRQRPMNLLMWRSLCWARARGARWYDFGTSLRDQKGLMRFKEGWGGSTTPLAYRVWVRPGERGRAVRQDASASQLASILLKILPACCFAWITSRLIRQFG